MSGWTQADVDRFHDRLVQSASAQRPPARVKKPRFDYADELFWQIQVAKLPLPAREHRPWTDRQFRLDLAWLDRKMFAECDGGEWIQGQHARGQGMIDDCYKWNRLTLDGWRGFRFTGTDVKNGTALTVVETALTI